MNPNHDIEVDDEKRKATRQVPLGVKISAGALMLAGVGILAFGVLINSGDPGDWLILVSTGLLCIMLAAGLLRRSTVCFAASILLGTLITCALLIHNTLVATIPFVFTLTTLSSIKHFTRKTN